MNYHRDPIAMLLSSLKTPLCSNYNETYVWHILLLRLYLWQKHFIVS